MSINKKDMSRIILIDVGATGYDVTRDLVLRGYKTILIEFKDL